MDKTANYGVDGGGSLPQALPKQKTQIAAKQVRGVEDPATVICVPVHLGDGIKWWSYDDILIGGIKVNGTPVKEKDGLGHSVLGYLPIPIPRSWGEREFNVVVEYEAEDGEAKFKFKLFYGCGDPSELHLGESQVLTGKAGKKERIYFKLNPECLVRNELIRVSLDIARETPHPILIYGVWLELKS